MTGGALRLAGCLVLLATSPLAASPLHLEKAARYSDKAGGRILLIWERGQLFKHENGGITAPTPVDVMSITKSIVAMQWLSRFSPDEPVAIASGLRARDLLSQTSGLSAGDERLYRRNLRNVRREVLLIRRQSPSGSVFVYGPAHYELLGAELSIRLGDRKNPPLELLKRLGIQTSEWRSDREGNAFASAGARLSGNDLLKIGRLLLDGGSAGPFLKILPRGRLTSALKGTRANPAYGLGFWLNVNAAAPGAQESDVELAIKSGAGTDFWKRMALSSAAPPDLFCMAGSFGQRVYIVPSRRLVIVRLGSGRKFRDPEFLRTLFAGKPPA